MRKCMVCGADITERARKRDNIRYCSQGCVNKASNAKRKGKHPKRVRHHTCIDCGAPFDSSKYGALRCVECRGRQNKGPPYSVVKTENCSFCGVLYVGKPQSTLCIACRSRTQWERKCIESGGNATTCLCCGVEFCRIPGTGIKTCSDECSLTLKRTSRAKQKQKRRTENAIDPRQVFEADKWSCRACGVRTPPRLRGTIEGNAPELDHIVPVAAGGDTTIENTQTLCRDCNQLKSDMSMYEFIDAYLGGERDAWSFRWHEAIHRAGASHSTPLTELLKLHCKQGVRGRGN